MAASPTTRDVELRRDGRGLALVSEGLVLRGDFMRLLPRTRPDRLRSELLVRAARLRGMRGGPLVVDATAGLGEDAFLLAANGSRVVMYERNPLVAALLSDALARGSHEPSVADVIGRMSLVEGDSVLGLSRLDVVPDVVLLDPMFPAKRKDAASKKKLQVLQRIVGPCADEGELLEAALAARPRKVVVKRPVSGPYLANRGPSYSIKGNTVRYDCYVVANQQRVHNGLEGQTCSANAPL